MEIAEAIERTRDGDTEAFCRVVGEYQEMVRGYVARFVLDREDVFDLAQETFVSAFRRIDTYRTSGDFGAWLRGIARTTTLEHMRKASRRRKHEANVAEQFIELRMCERLEDDRGETSDLLSLLRACVDALKGVNERGYAFVHGRYFRGQPVEDIAREHSLASAAVRMALMRLRAQLRQCVQQRLATGGEHA